MSATGHMSRSMVYITGFCCGKNNKTKRRKTKKKGEKMPKVKLNIYAGSPFSCSLIATTTNASNAVKNASNVPQKINGTKPAG